MGKVLCGSVLGTAFPMHPNYDHQPRIQFQSMCPLDESSTLHHQNQFWASTMKLGKLGQV
jgi:hypothetical protein